MTACSSTTDKGQREITHNKSLQDCLNSYLPLSINTNINCNKKNLSEHFMLSYIAIKTNTDFLKRKRNNDVNESEALHHNKSKYKNE